eukprot:23600_6
MLALLRQDSKLAVKVCIESCLNRTLRYATSLALIEPEASRLKARSQGMHLRAVCNAYSGSIKARLKSRVRDSKAEFVS